MTFLLQKHHAIHRTQVRDSLRSFASGVALTGRLAAACLLLAGFLGVGSATAQAPPTILRLGGGAVQLSLDPQGVNEETPDPTDDLQWHNYQIGSADAVTDPGDHDGSNHATTSVFIGGLAQVAVDDVTNFKLTITPLATGSFEIALSEDADMPLSKGDDMTNVARSHEFVVVSANAPYIVFEPPVSRTSPTYNAAAKGDQMMIPLVPREMTMHDPINVIPLFNDPDDVLLTYEAKADPVKKTGTDGKEVDTDIVNATISLDNKLMISLTDKAETDDMTDVWLIARDPSGESARKRYIVSAGMATNPYTVDDNVVKNQTFRADDDNMSLSVGGDAFADDDLALDPNNDFDVDSDGGTVNPRKLEVKVTINDTNAQRITNTTGFTWVTTPMNVMVTGDGTENPMLDIDPRTAGNVSFTVTATDKGAICRSNNGKAGFAEADYLLIDKANAETTIGATGDTAPVKCWADEPELNTDGSVKTAADGMVDSGETTDLYPDSKSTGRYTFTVTIVSASTPSKDAAIPALELESDKGAMGAKTVDLNDVNGTKEGTPKAFKNYSLPLEYTVELGQETVKVGGQNVMRDVATASVEGSKVTVTPLWRAGTDAMVEAKVTATNDQGETAEATFMVKVLRATTPVVNPTLLQAIQEGNLPDTLSVTRGEKLEINLLDVRKLIDGGEMLPVAVPVFIDPNAKTVKEGELLPGGLQLRIRPEDVVTAHRYDDQSSDNDIYTSMGRLMLDPKTAMLTFYATAPNTMTVTITATDRERKPVMASMAITVPEVTSAEAEELPTEVSLSQNYPNPFNPRTTIEYALPEAGDVSLIVYDMLGREVTTLLEGPQAAGRHTVNFDANHLSNGTYVYRLVAPNKTITRTMVLVK